MALHDIEKKKIEKRLLKRLGRGEINVGQAALEMKKRGIQPSKKFCEELLKIFGKKAAAKQAEIEKREEYEREKAAQEEEFRRCRLEKEVDRDLSQAARKINNIMNPHLVDNELFRKKKKQFDRIMKGVRSGRISPHQAQLMGKELGLINYYKWWERYYQCHPDFVYKKKTKRE
ncbi:MAG: hypothetical protein QXO69_01950 [archaeon]